MKTSINKQTDVEQIWFRLNQQAETLIKDEPLLYDFVTRVILSQDCFASSISSLLATKLSCTYISTDSLYSLFRHLAIDPSITVALSKDLSAYLERDSACELLVSPYLFYKGFQATQAYRFMHCLWLSNQRGTALFIQSKVSEVFGVDIHPAAKLGSGIMLDHASGIVIGETVIVEDDVSIMQNVTLGGTGKDVGERHPIVRKGALISCGAKILGRHEVGEGAKIGAGSVVLSDVPPHRTAVGVPAKVVGLPATFYPSLEMDHMIADGSTSHKIK